jgi:DNA-binding MarR family transcriptional regulator
MRSLEVEPDSEEIFITARDLRRGVTELYRRLRAERISHGLSPSKLSVLGRLALSGPLTVTALAAKERIQPQSLTRILADLERRELITRHQDTIDRRQSLVEITELGEDLLRQDARRQAAWLATVMSSALTPVERQLLRLAAQLMQRLANTQPATAPDSRESGAEASGESSAANEM